MILSRIVEAIAEIEVEHRKCNYIFLGEKECAELDAKTKTSIPAYGWDFAVRGIAVIPVKMESFFFVG